MTDLPNPPVPMTVDLGGYGFMPLHGHRLFGSDFNARCNDAEWRAGLTLWWASWNQVPASSLPDDDVVLCMLAGLGRNLRAWSKVRNNALRGFVRCSDGRLYHGVLARLALEAWDRRVKDRERKARWRERINVGSDGPGDGDIRVSGDGTSPLKRSEATGSEAKRSDRKRTKKTHTPPNPPQAGGGVGVASGGDDFDSKLTALLDRLGVASGPNANRRWLAQAQRNPHATTDDDLLRVVANAVKRAREVRGSERVNHASDVREFVTVWRPAPVPERAGAP